MSESLRRSRRRIGIVVTLALLIGSSLAWRRSRTLRFAVYESVYPLSPSWLRRSIEDRFFKEGRPGLGYRLRLSHEATSSSDLWDGLYWNREELEIRICIKEPVLKTALDPRASPYARCRATAYAAHARYREPRLAPAILDYIKTPKFLDMAEGLGAIGGDPERARRALDRELERYQLPGRNLALVLRGYAGLGPAARASLEKIRPWRDCGDAQVENAADLALWCIAGERPSLERLQRRCRETPAEKRGFRHRLSKFLVRAGVGAEVQAEQSEGLVQKLEGPGGARSLSYIAGLGFLDPAVLDELAEHEDEAVAEVARLIRQDLDRKAAKE